MDPRGNGLLKTFEKQYPYKINLKGIRNKNRKCYKKCDYTNYAWRTYQLLDWSL